jgi:hypothetical protein
MIKLEIFTQLFPTDGTQAILRSPNPVALSRIGEKSSHINQTLATKAHAGPNSSALI